MDEKQEDHLKELKDWFVKDVNEYHGEDSEVGQKIIKDFNEHVDLKYRRGEEEHGGDLWKKMGLIIMAEEELVDLWAYYGSMVRQVKRLKDVDLRDEMMGNLKELSTTLITMITLHYTLKDIIVRSGVRLGEMQE